MILSTTKKVIAIYSLSSLFFLFASLCSVAMAETSADLNSYCFDRTVNLHEVHQSLKLLLLPKDIVEFRTEDNCLDIATSPERGQLFLKYLGKRHDLKKDIREDNKVFVRSSDAENEQMSVSDLDCRIDLKTTKKTKTDASNFKVGKKNVLNKSETSNQSVSTTELLLGAGKIGEIEAGEENLKVICYLIGEGSANLVFSYADKNKASITSELRIRKNEWINIASVLKDLNDKTKTLGIPQTEISQSSGKVEIIYELQFR